MMITAHSKNPIIAELQHNLMELRDFLQSIDSKTYQHKKDFDASIGVHVRHCIEHLHILLNQWKSKRQNRDKDRDAVINYDLRSRNPRWESSLATIQQCVQKLFEELETLLTLSPEILETRILVSFLSSQNTDTFIVSKSTLGRELSFIAHHNTHHMAFIRSLYPELKYQKNFGIAPSTRAHLQESH